MLGFKSDWALYLSVFLVVVGVAAMIYFPLADKHSIWPYNKPSTSSSTPVPLVPPKKQMSGLELGGIILGVCLALTLLLFSYDHFYGGKSRSAMSYGCGGSMY